MAMVRMLFSEVRVTSVADSPVLLLREAEGERVLPIWITASSGNAILNAATPQLGEPPHTHELAVDLLAAVDRGIDECRITAMTDGHFEAEVEVGGLTVTARPTDVIALALRSGAPLMVPEELLDLVGVAPGLSLDPTLKAGSDSQMEEFKAFLDTINPEDFDPS